MKIIHEESFQEGFNSLKKSIDLRERGILPDSLTHIMIEIPMLRMFRSIHGKSNLWVAFYLMRRALTEWWRYTIMGIRQRSQLLYGRHVLRLDPEQNEARLDSLIDFQTK